jgi:5-formyltetrahydrofolate cyclo-ligase
MTGETRIPRAPAVPPVPAASEAAIDKAQLRKTLLAARRAIDPATRAAWDARLCARVMGWYAAQAGTLAGAAPAGLAPIALGVYWPLRGEPDLAPAYAALAVAGVALVLPVVLARDAPLGFAAWTPGEPMTVDTMGVAVPAALRMVAAPPLLLVPCLGVNAQGYRLGYGGGYYDRTLATLPRPRTAGVVYACMRAGFGAAAHDVALDAVLTEAG